MLTVVPVRPLTRDLPPAGAPLAELTPATLHALQAVEGYPLVSVLVSTAPDLLLGAEEVGRIVALLRVAAMRLERELPLPMIEALLAPMHRLAADLVGHRSGRALALLGADGGAVAYRLGVAVEDRVVIDPTFATRDLARSLAENPQHRVVVLGQGSARLLVGTSGRLVEVHDDVFPMRETSSALDTRRHRLEAERGTKALHDEAAFVRRVTTALAAHHTDALPLFAVAPTTIAARLRRPGRVAVLGVVVGSHERTPASRVTHLVRSCIDGYLADVRERALARLQHAERRRNAVLGIQQVWTAASRGTVDTLLVDPAFRFPAWSTLGGTTIVRAFSPELPDVIDDAVDEVIELVQRRGATVCFVRPGDLGEERIAAVLRHN